MAILFDGEIGWSITKNDILQAGNDGVEEIIISSFGGDLYEGLAIMDAIALQGKIKTVGVIGVCASAATFAVLGAQDRWASENARFLIHNPWQYADGDAKAIQKTADELLKEQNIIVAKYSELSGKPVEEIQAIMDKSQFLTAQEALALNLITRIKTKNETMEKIEVNEKLSFFDSWFNKISNQIKNAVKPKIKNEVIQDVNGIEIDFGENAAVVGNVATINGKPANGDYVMVDGSTYKFENGTLTEISTPEPEVVDEAMKQENEALKNKVSELENQIQNLVSEKETIQNGFKAVTTDFENMKSEFSKFKNEFSHGTTPPAKPDESSKRVFWIKK